MVFLANEDLDKTCHTVIFSDGTVLLQSETKNEVIYSSKENQLELLEAWEDELEAGVIQ